MFVATPHAFVMATFLGGWELVLILAAVLVLLGARKLPPGLGRAISEFRKALDHQAHDAGKCACGILGKPAAEALTPDNHTAELYDPAAFHRRTGKRSVWGILRDLWRRIFAWLNAKR